MGIDARPKADTSPEDQETLRRVYQDELRGLNLRLDAAKSRARATQVELHEAQREHTRAATEAARLEGQIDAVRAIAARDGITDL